MRSGAHCGGSWGTPQGDGAEAEGAGVEVGGEVDGSGWARVGGVSQAGGEGGGVCWGSRRVLVQWRVAQSWE